MRTFTLGEIAQRIGGRLVGPADLTIRAANILRDAGPGEITFADKPRLAQQAERCGASAVITSGAFDAPRLPHITVTDVPAAFAQVVALLRPPTRHEVAGISHAAHVSPSAKLAEDVRVGPGATIGDGVEIGPHTTIHSGVHVMAGCRIGSHGVLFPGVVLYEDTHIGERVVIHAGAVIGAWGFGYTTVEGKHQLSAQLGRVEIHDDVEIGANTTIDRGTFGPTVIGEGTKIDNLVMIAHNCRIGRHNLLCSQVGIAGSCTTGDYVAMAGQVGIRDHVHIGSMAQIGAKAGVSGPVPDGANMLGTPAVEERQFIQQALAAERLPEMRRQLRALRRQLKQESSAPEPPAGGSRDQGDSREKNDKNDDQPHAA